VRLIDADGLRRALPMAAAIDALERAFSGALPNAPLRSHVETPAGTLLLMPAAGAEGVGVKLVTLTPSNPERGLPLIHALYALFDADTQAPLAILDGAALTALRTRVVVVSRTLERAEVLAAELRASGLPAEVGAPEAVAEADLVCTCTTSPTPVFDGRLLPPGAHVNAVGAYTPQTRELDEATILRARVVVETREAALAEAGDLLIPMREGKIGPEHVVADLAEVVRGAAVRRSAEDVTVFESVGVAFEDLVVARAALEGIRP
jgi:ornithine cyclodeaminase/alanine dehydrogenase-like protein (mu-crystallin family)